MTAAARFHAGTYLDGDYKVFGPGDHIISGGVFGNNTPFQSLHLEPGTLVMLDGNDVEWCGGLHGRDWFHVGYLSQYLGLACNGGRPTRIRVQAMDGPVVALYNEERYNRYKDVVTMRPPVDRASGGHLMDGWLHDKIQGAIVEEDMTAYLCRSSHGGPSDPSPYKVVGPKDTGHLPAGWAGYINSVKGAMHGYTLQSVEYDWAGRQVHDSGDYVAGSADAINQSDREQSVSIEIDFSEGASTTWNLNAGFASTTEVSLSAGVKPFGIGADVSASQSIELSTSLDNGSQKDTSRSVSIGIDVTVPPRSKMPASLMAKRESCTVKTISKFKNDVTGKIVERHGSADIRMHVRGNPVFGAAEPLA